ncbi:uncharacterized protein LOC129584293 [Paramacrobiotus metropolitanus]|uniref:uncharacterized protein LOC129584293 n=1 Tax=Paramacrobiotus metropolitanus TaxID=2943436 RepID=UPI00244576B3|nr:uncharacterized protein LOC129584293 [Paramacrobiotus metropolitanus]
MDHCVVEMQGEGWSYPSALEIPVTDGSHLSNLVLALSIVVIVLDVSWLGAILPHSPLRTQIGAFLISNCLWDLFVVISCTFIYLPAVWNDILVSVVVGHITVIAIIRYLKTFNTAFYNQWIGNKKATCSLIILIPTISAFIIIVFGCNKNNASWSPYIDLNIINPFMHTSALFIVLGLYGRLIRQMYRRASHLIISRAVIQREPRPLEQPIPQAHLKIRKFLQSNDFKITRIYFTAMLVVLSHVHLKIRNFLETKEYKASRMYIAMTLAAIFPVWLHCMIRFAGLDQFREILYCLMLLNSCINPILLFLLNRNYRTGFKLTVNQLPCSVNFRSKTGLTSKNAQWDEMAIAFESS